MDGGGDHREDSGKLPVHVPVKIGLSCRDGGQGILFRWTCGKDC